jgi:hypothetical protein
MWGGATLLLTSNVSVELFQHVATVLRGYTVAHRLRNYCIWGRLIQWANWAATQRPQLTILVSMCLKLKLTYYNGISFGVEM